MTRTRLVAAGAGLLAVVIGAVLVLYFVVLGGAAQAPLSLSTTGSAARTQASPLAASSVAGTWTIAPGSVAGYRVREQLGFLPAPSDAVGRTSAVTGSVTIDGSADALSVTAADLTVDVSTLTSDRPMRDQHIHESGLESDRYPKATFELTQPISLPADATSGATIAVSATGKLTIHGMTQTVTIPLTARLSANLIEVAGSTTFPFERFGMTPPSIAGLVSVQDSATMEFDIKLRHA